MSEDMIQRCALCSHLAMYLVELTALEVRTLGIFPKLRAAYCGKHLREALIDIGKELESIP